MNSPCVFRKRETEKFLAFIEITNSCNMKCKHCMNWSIKDSNNGLKKDEILKLIKDLYNNNTEEIYISGGEPLLYPYIDDVILYAHSLGIKVTLATNALEVPNHLVAIKKGVQLVSISLDGIGKTHDNFRGVDGAYDNCINVFRLLKENGVSKVNLAFLIPEGRAKNDESIRLPMERYKEIIDMVADIRKKYKDDNFDIEIRRNAILDHNSMDCPGGKNLIHINVNGKVSPCSWIAKLDTENEYSDYWPENSIKECIEKFKIFRDEVNQRKQKYGYTGCVALSKIYNGNFSSQDPLNSFLEEK